MIDLRREEQGTGPVITGFSGGGFRLGETIVAGGLLLTPERATDWDAPPLAELRAGHLDVALDIEPAPEFLLLGTGKRLRRPSAELVEELERRDIGLEVMDSRAAARIWGLLRAEERWISAALLPLSV